MYFSKAQSLRKESDYTQEFVANYLKCKRSTYANWETGYIMLPIDVAGKLAMLYKVPMSYVLGFNENNRKCLIKPINYEYMRTKLRENKKHYKQTYLQIAKYIDTDKSTVYRYFTGKVQIPTDKLMLLCRLYELEIDDLCGTK